MYNHYVPGSSGIYQRTIVEEPKKDLPCPKSPEPLPPKQPSQQERPVSTGGPFHMDLGDLLLLCVVLLLWIDSEEEDWTALLITAAAFLLSQ